MAAGSGSETVRRQKKDEFEKNMKHQIITIITVLSLFFVSCDESSYQDSIMSVQDNFEFPGSIDTQKKYLFYLHGKIIEDQGVPAISPQFGEYEYDEILRTFSENGFYVISEKRTKNTNAAEYSNIVVEQVKKLIAAGVPSRNITIVGASKGAAITILISHYLENEDVNFVLLAICHPDVVKEFIQDEVSLKGNLLSIYDEVDNLAGSCRNLFSYSEGKGISRFEEIVLQIGTGHGILYQPLDEWMNPTIEWANANGR